MIPAASVSMAESPTCRAVAFLPGGSCFPAAPHSLLISPADGHHISRQRALHCAVRKRALICSSLAYGIEVLEETGDRVQEDPASPLFEPKKVVIAKGKARLFW